MVKLEFSQNNYESDRGSSNHVSQQLQSEIINGNEKILKKRDDSSLGLLFFDLDVLRCTTCSKVLSIFQCEVCCDIFCFFCSLKSRKCPSCNLLTEFPQCNIIDKVFNSLRMPCQNSAYGCEEIFPYSTNKHVHEKCTYSPYSCPLATCDFVGSSFDLATHCKIHHCTIFIYDKWNSVLMDLSEKYKFYKVGQEDSIFIVRNIKHYDLNALSVCCIGPTLAEEGFSYNLVATSPKGRSLRLMSITEIVQEIPTDESRDLHESLIVPSNWFSDTIELQLLIWKDNEDVDV